MTTDPSEVDEAFVVDFDNAKTDSELADAPDTAVDNLTPERAATAGFGCRLCSKKGQFSDTLGDAMYEAQRARGENILLVCEECAEEHDITPLN